MYMEELDLLKLAEIYAKKLKEIKNRYPYHVNPIEELHANENANSRILCALLRYQIDGEYKILKSFIKRFFAEFQIDIGVTPTIETEQYRIDLSVRETKKYAIIFENKIHDAGLQKNQLARYIEKLKNEEGFEYEQIYIVFLPSSGYYEPNDCSWHKEIPGKCGDSCNGECKLKDQKPELRERFEKEGRYQKVTFREDILNWLKEDVLPNLLYKETLLQASVLLYIYYLEGLFNLRTTENNKFMELREYIIKELKLDRNCSIEDKIEELLQKMHSLDELKKEMNNLYDDYRREYIKSRFEGFINDFKEIIKDVENKFNLITDFKQVPKENFLFSLGFKREGWDLYILFDCYIFGGFYVYIGKHCEETTNGYMNQNYCIPNWEQSYINNHPHGWKWLIKTDPNNDDFLKSLESNKGERIKEYLMCEIDTILNEIEKHPNEITMTIPK